MVQTVSQIKKKIESITPVTPRHTESEHWYEVAGHPALLPSVTTCLQSIKDASLRNYQVNRALDYMFENASDLSPQTIMTHLSVARGRADSIRDEAGDIGTAIHDVREAMFRGESVRNMPQMVDSRVVSGARALRKFLDDTGYVPIASEILVYEYNKHAKQGVAGAIDDIGLLPKVYEPGNPDCEHDYVTVDNEPIVGEKQTCIICGYKVRYRLVLMDLKTSNQFKDHYHAQVGLYAKMFQKLTGLRLSEVFILKASKEDGTYKIEQITDLPTAIQVGELAVKLHYSLGKLRESRKPQRIKL